MASAAEKAVVVSDLANFRRSASIALDAAPDQVLNAHGKLYAVCSADQTIVLIDAAHRTITGKISVGGKITSTTLTDDGNWLAVAVSQPAAVIFIDTRSDKIVRRTALPGAPTAISASSEQIAVLLESTAQTANSSRLARINIADGKLIGVSLVGAGPLSALGLSKRRRDDLSSRLPTPGRLFL